MLPPRNRLGFFVPVPSASAIKMNDEVSGPSSRSINQAKEGDVDAKNRIAEKVRDYAKRKIAPTTPDRSDIAQEVAHAVDQGLEGATHFENRRSFWGWVRRIVRNKLITQNRKRRPHVVLSERDDVGIPSDSASPSRVAGQSELAAWAKHAVAALTEEDQRVWQLRSQDEVEFDELAAQLNLEKEAVKKRYYRIRDRLLGGVRLLIRLDVLERSGVVDLPSNYRQAIVWNEITGLSHGEIGQRLGLSANAVSRILARVRSTLGVEKESVS
jgi:RNA polymerase sigma-70 factor (ECF subfamily)